MPIAYFVTPHGFGHATRAAAVMAALQQQKPGLCVDIFTQAPRRIFEESLPGPFVYRDVLTDLGLVQKTPMQADLPASLARLDALMPFSDALVNNLADQVRDCACVCCDIAPLGIAVAKQAGLPSVLIENFTWDWIYAPYVAEAPGFARHIAYLRDLFCAPDHHIQTQPACDVRNGAFSVPPVSRPVRQSRDSVRRALNLPDSASAVMITMGGTPFQYADTRALGSQDTFFLLPNSGQTLRREHNLIHIPRDAPLFHPDLVNASDAVIGKVGYSTLAEVYRAGVPFGYIPRPGFRESDALVPFIAREMPGLPIAETDFESGAWLSLLPELLSLPRARRTGPNGADIIADHLLREVLP